jgi:hypothetical protein
MSSEVNAATGGGGPCTSGVGSRTGRMVGVGRSGVTTGADGEVTSANVYVAGEAIMRNGPSAHPFD